MPGAGGAWLILAAAVFLVAVAAAVFLLQQVLRRAWDCQREQARKIAAASASGSASKETDRFIRRHPWVFLRECAAIVDGIDLSDSERSGMRAAIERNRLDFTLIRDLNGRSRHRRIRASVYLPLVPSDAAR